MELISDRLLDENAMLLERMAEQSGAGGAAELAMRHAADALEVSPKANLIREKLLL